MNSVVYVILFVCLFYNGVAKRIRSPADYECLHVPKQYRSDCYSIMRNEDIVELYQQVKEQLNTKREKRSRTSVCDHFNYQNIKECPTFNESYLETHLRTEERSLSPYDTFINCDSLRVPRLVQEKRCLCGGCIDHTNKRETHKLSSQPIMYKMSVLRLVPTLGNRRLTVYNRTTEAFVAGCTCMSPLTV